MLSYSSSLVWKKQVNHHVWQQLAQLWLITIAQDETSLITEDSSFKILDNEPQIPDPQQLKIDEFFELIMPQFNDLLQQ